MYLMIHIKCKFVYAPVSHEISNRDADARTRVLARVPIPRARRVNKQRTNSERPVSNQLAEMHTATGNRIVALVTKQQQIRLTLKQASQVFVVIVTARVASLLHYAAASGADTVSAPLQRLIWRLAAGGNRLRQYGCGHRASAYEPQSTIR